MPESQSMESKQPARRERVNKLRAELIAELGGRCVVCGDTRDLLFHEFEYPYGEATKGGHSVGSENRAYRVKRLINEGNLNAVTVMCRRCHQAHHANLRAMENAKHVRRGSH